jgi:beta-glucanase (GH16 family)
MLILSFMKNILGRCSRSSLWCLTRRLGPVLVLAVALWGRPTAAQAQCDQLVWSDEFATDGDLSKWRVYEGDGCETGQCGFGNNELQVYRAANATVTGGYLNITTRAQTSVLNGRSYNYTSAKLFSRTAANALQTFRYGRMEASMKLPSAQGIWPAFWMLPNPSNWPTTGEIDIMEAKHRNPTSVAGTIHYNANGWHYTTRLSTGSVDLSAGFHTYAVEWSPDLIKWFIDNTLYHTATPQTTTGNSWPFNAGNFYLMLNAAVGGPNTAFTGNQNPLASDYPTTTQVDYVRVYAGRYNNAVAGSTQVFGNDQGSAYQIAAIAGASYAWTVPAGANVAAGQGTNAIQVNWGLSSGNVTVVVTVAGCPTATYSLPVAVGAPLPIGPNLALRKPAFASSEEAAGLEAYRAVDGDATSRWASNFSNNEWLYVDLQGTYNLTQVLLRWEAAYGRGYEVQTSLDAQTWTPRFITTTGDGGVDNIVLAGTARYVRLLGQQRATTYGYSLYEMEVYGTSVLGTTGRTTEALPAHPNPVAARLTVELAGRVAPVLTLFDGQGRVVRQQAVPAGHGQAQLDLEGLPSGVYLLKILDNKHVSVQKIIKQ